MTFHRPFGLSDKITTKLVGARNLPSPGQDELRSMAGGVGSGMVPRFGTFRPAGPVVTRYPGVGSVPHRGKSRMRVGR